MIQIRSATKRDVEELQRVKPSLTLEQVKERFERQAKGEAEFIVLERDGEIVSFVLLKWRGKPTHPEYPDMEDLYTKESERSKGYGSMLVDKCEKKAKGKGFTKIGLAVNPQLNNPARKLYERLGYRYDGKKRYVDAVYNGVEDWCIDMEKELK